MAQHINGEWGSDNGGWTPNGAATVWQCVATKDDATTYASLTGAAVAGKKQYLKLEGTIDHTLNYSAVPINFRARRVGAIGAGTILYFALIADDGSYVYTFTFDATTLTTSWVDYQLFINGTFTAPGTVPVQRPAIWMAYLSAANAGEVDITYVSLGTENAIISGAAELVGVGELFALGSIAEPGLQHPWNIRKALPTSTGLPQVVIDAYRPPGRNPAAIAYSLPISGALIPDHLLDAYLPQGNEPQRIEDALPTRGVIIVTPNPNTGEQQGGWGVVDGLGGNNYALAMLVCDGDTTIIQSDDGNQVAGCEFSIGNFSLGWPTNGWEMHVVFRKAGGVGPLVQEQVVTWRYRQWNGSAFSGGAQVVSATPVQGFYADQSTAVYQDIGIAVTPADIASLQNSPRTTMQFTNVAAGGTPGVVMNVTCCYFIRF